MMDTEKNKITSNTNLNVIREKWSSISEDFNKQIEKSCYTGIAIIWMFIVIGEFNYENKLLYSIICFVIPLIISFSFSLYELFNNYNIFIKSYKRIQNGEILNNIDLNPSKFGLFISSLYFMSVFVGYILVVIYSFETFFYK